MLSTQRYDLGIQVRPRFYEMPNDGYIHLPAEFDQLVEQKMAVNGGISRFTVVPYSS